MRLPAIFRIKASREFARLKREGSTHPGRYLVLSVLRDEKEEKFKFGLVTTRKVGPAVVRNKIRRRIREVVRHEQAQIVPGLLMVIIARWRAPQASVEDLRRDLLKLAQRAGILQPKGNP